jgi:hypothetical protein
MGALWSPCANIAIFLIIYSYRKWWVWLHMVFFAVATIATLATALPIYFTTGLVAADSPADYGDYDAPTLHTHYLLGLVCCGAATVVSTMGSITRLLLYCNARSTLILLMRRIHTWSGYVAVLLCKANVYVMGGEALWIAVDAIFIVMYVGWRLLFPKLEARGISPKY